MGLGHRVGAGTTEVGRFLYGDSITEHPVDGADGEELESVFVTGLALRGFGEDVGSGGVGCDQSDSSNISASVSIFILAAIFPQFLQKVG